MVFFVRPAFVKTDDPFTDRITDVVAYNYEKMAF